MTFQSRFGPAAWLEPATDPTVKRLAKDGVKNLAVITPGLSADCLETLGEIAVRERATSSSITAASISPPSPASTTERGGDGGDPPASRVRELD